MERQSLQYNASIEEQVRVKRPYHSFVLDHFGAEAFRLVCTDLNQHFETTLQALVVLLAHFLDD